MNTKRFVIRKSLIGKNTVTSPQLLPNSASTSKGTFKYNHDSIYNEFQEKFDTMNCFIKYGNYTNSNVIPAFARHLEIKE